MRRKERQPVCTFNGRREPGCSWSSSILNCQALEHRPVNADRSGKWRAQESAAGQGANCKSYTLGRQKDLTTALCKDFASLEGMEGMKIDSSPYQLEGRD